MAHLKNRFVTPTPVSVADTLEPRRLFSSSVSNGVLVVAGTPTADTISIVYYPASGYTVSIGGEADSTYPAADVTNLVIHAGGGNDTVVLSGVSINATIFGGNGADSIISGDGNDLIRGGHGSDTIFGEGGNDTIFGGHGNDLLLGDSWLDSPVTGDDLLRGGEGSDELHGSHGNDTLHGGLGDDSLNGGDGTDRIRGGQGVNDFSIQTATVAGNDLPSEVLDFTPSDLNDIGAYNPDAGGGAIQGGTINEIFTLPINQILTLSGTLL